SIARLNGPAPGADIAAKRGNLSTNAAPKVTARLRSKRGRSGAAAPVLNNRRRKNTLTASRGTPDSGVRTARTCAAPAQSVVSTTRPLRFARSDRDTDSSRSGARAALRLNTL